MKKLFAAIIGAALMFSGLVSVAGSAHAAAEPYPGSVKTRTIAEGLATKESHAAKVYVKVTSYGNGAPSGKLEFTFVHKRSGKADGFTRAYDADAKRYTFHGLRPGTYAVVVNFVPPEDSVYKPSTAKTRTKVRK
jgi:hypothetical protein